MDPIFYGDDLVTSLTDVTREAGDIAMDFFRAGAKTSAEVSHKDCGSPVTEADYLVDRFLKERLPPLVPGAGWLSEETADTSERLSKNLMIIVDPIDGTRGFAAGDRVWAVAVALIEAGRPTIGILHAPALGETFVAVRGRGATLNGEAIEVSRRGLSGPDARFAGPKPIAQDLRRAGLTFDLLPRVGSLALRIAYVASGVLDAGFATGNSHDWDIAAADLILQEAGGLLADLDGVVPIYNRADTRHGLLTAAPIESHAAINAALRRGRALAKSAASPEH